MARAFDPKKPIVGLASNRSRFQALQDATDAEGVSRHRDELIARLRNSRNFEEAYTLFSELMRSINPAASGVEAAVGRMDIMFQGVLGGIRADEDRRVRELIDELRKGASANALYEAWQAAQRQQAAEQRARLTADEIRAEEDARWGRDNNLGGNAFVHRAAFASTATTAEMQRYYDDLVFRQLSGGITAGHTGFGVATAATIQTYFPDALPTSTASAAERAFARELAATYRGDGSPGSVFNHVVSAATARTFDGGRLPTPEARVVVGAATRAAEAEIDKAYDKPEADKRKKVIGDVAGPVAKAREENRPLTPEEQAKAKAALEAQAAEWRAIADKLRELFPQWLANPDDKGLRERFEKLQQQMRAMRRADGTMELAADPELFARRLADLVNNGVITPEKARELEELRRRADPNKTDRTNDLAEMARLEAETRLRKEFGDAQLELFEKKGIISKEKMEELKAKRAEALALPPGHPRREEILKGMAPELKKAREERLKQKDAEFDQLMKDAEDPTNTAARERLLKEVETRARLLEEAQRYLANPEEFARALQEGRTGLGDIADYRHIVAQKEKYDEARELLESLGVHMSPDLAGQQVPALRGVTPQEAAKFNEANAAPAAPPRELDAAGKPKWEVDEGGNELKGVPYRDPKAAPSAVVPPAAPALSAPPAAAPPKPSEPVPPASHRTGFEGSPEMPSRREGAQTLAPAAPPVVDPAAQPAAGDGKGTGEGVPMVQSPKAKETEVAVAPPTRPEDKKVAEAKPEAAAPKGVA